MKKIKEDVKKKEFQRVYLVYGEEQYITRNVKKMLMEGILGDGDKMNALLLKGKECDARRMIEFSNTLPFFSDYRLVLAEESGWFQGAPDEMVDYITKIPETSCIVFIERDVDKRNRLYKQIKAQGYVCECKRATDRELKDWMLRYLTREHKKITADTMEYLLETLGNDMQRIMNELEKLVSYTLGRDIVTREDIDAVCVAEITGKVFEMIDAIGNRNLRKAMELYEDLLATREAPMKILYLMIRQFHIMLQLMELEESHIPRSEMAGKVGVQSFVVNKTLAQCRNFSYGTVKAAISYAISLEESVKLGKIKDKLAVELVLIRYGTP